MNIGENVPSAPHCRSWNAGWCHDLPWRWPGPGSPATDRPSADGMGSLFHRSPSRNPWKIHWKMDENAGNHWKMKIYDVYYMTYMSFLMFLDENWRSKRVRRERSSHFQWISCLISNMIFVSIWFTSQCIQQIPLLPNVSQPLVAPWIPLAFSDPSVPSHRCWWPCQSALPWSSPRYPPRGSGKCPCPAEGVTTGMGLKQKNRGVKNWGYRGIASKI